MKILTGFLVKKMGPTGRYSTESLLRLSEPEAFEQFSLSGHQGTERDGSIFV